MLIKLGKEPLVHFLLLGACIYVLYGWLASEDTDDDAMTITVTASDVEALSGQWTRLWRRPPTKEEFDGVVRDWVQTQILYREALAMGLEQGDTVIERRLAQKLELLAKGVITPAEPGDDVLRAWYAENIDAFTDPDFYTISQVFFDVDRRGDSVIDDASAALTELRSLDGVPEDLSPYGDRLLMLETYYPARTRLDLQKAFGIGFVDEIAGLEVGQWHGPVASGYGPHLVFVHDVLRARSPEFDAIRNAVKDAWVAEQVDELSERFIADIVSRYNVVVEDSDAPIAVPRTPKDGAEP